MRGLRQQTDRPEAGATLVLVAASLLVIMGMAALTIDVGNGYRTRRGLVQATDAAALAAAQAYVDGSNGCATIDDEYVAANWPDASTQHTCQAYGSSDRGFVVVDADSNVDTWFAGVVGAGDFRVPSHSAALWSPPDGVTGLRPIGICSATALDSGGTVESLLGTPPTGTVTVTMGYTKDEPDLCGGEDIPGNWGIVDFDFGANSNSDTKAWVLDGYPDPVHFGDDFDGSCDSHCYEGDTGALSGIANELAILRDRGIFFTVPVFDHAQDPGANALFHLTGVLRVRLVDFRVNGAEDDRYFTFQVERGLITGTCCSGGGQYGGNKIIALCAVDPGAYGACDP